MIDLYNGDCLELMKGIPDGAIDLILTDIPYGTMKGAPIDSWQRHGDCCDWDTALPIAPMFEECSRVLRPNGRCILFSQEPLTSKLITQALPSLPFGQRAAWYKNTAGNSLMANNALVSRYEDINIFTKCRHDYGGNNPLREYFRDVLNFIGLNSAKDINKVLGHRKAEHTFYVTEGKRAIKETIGGKGDHTCRVGSSQFALCTEAVYNELIQKFDIDKMAGFRQYAELKTIQDDFIKSISPVFNLWAGQDSKSNVFEYNKPTNPVHPTQKPVPLLEDLIETYTNKGDTVLDFTMGSGSTGVAAVACGRDFIGIELDEKYFKIAQKRINDEMAQGKLF